MERLQRQLRERQAEVSRCERLLKLADPDGYFKEGTRAAADAKARGSSLLAAERSRKEAAAVKLRQQQVRHPSEPCREQREMNGYATVLMDRAVLA